MNRFEDVTQNKHGLFNPKKTDYTTIEQDLKSAKPIWELLGLTEDEYYAKYHPPAEPIKVVENDVQVKEE